MTSSANDHRDRGPPPSIAQALVAWLTSISTWNRAAIAIVLGTAALLGYLVFTYPHEAFDVAVVVLQDRRTATGPHAELTPYRTDVARALAQLLHAMAPEMIGAMAWRVDLPSNSMQLVDYAVAEEYKATMKDLEKRWEYPVTVFRDNPKINDIIARLYLGRFVCTTPADTWEEVLKRFPVAEICLIAVPPEGIGLAGMIAGAWTRAIEDHARVEMAFHATAHGLIARAN